MLRVSLFLVIVFSGFGASFKLQAQNEISGSFRRQLDALRWNYGLNFSQNIFGSEIQVSNRFQTSLFLLNGNAENIQDRNDASVNIQTPLNDQFSVTGRFNSFRFSVTDVATDQGSFGLRYSSDWGSIEPSLGIMRDARSGQDNQGLALGLRASTKPLKAENFTATPNLSLYHANINPRTFTTLSLNSNFTYHQDDFRLKGDLKLGRSVRESFQPSNFLNVTLGNAVESIQTDTTAISAQAQFPVLARGQGLLSVYGLSKARQFTNRADEEVLRDIIDSRFSSLIGEVQFRIDYPIGNHRVYAQSGYQARQEEANLINIDRLAGDLINRRRNILQNTVFDESRLSLRGGALLQAHPRSRWELAGQISLLRYDTPEVNFDDRDELFFSFLVQNHYKFSDEFSSTITLAGEATHNVYLFSQRSAENNWRRSLRLVPEFRWLRENKFDIRQRFLIRANYTVFDFGEDGVNQNDQASREWISDTQANIHITRNWRVDPRVSRSELRIGRLDWKNFSETPLDTLITWDSQLMLTRLFEGGLVSLGFRYFQKTDFQPISELRIELTQPDGSTQTVIRRAPGKLITQQFGPAIDVQFPFITRHELILKGWLQIQRIRQKLYTEFPDELRSTFRRAERDFPRRSIPNMELVARFYF